MTTTYFEEILKILTNNDVKFILIGGLAATYQGSAKMTQDIDILYQRSDENIKCLISALAPLKPYLRGVPAGLPFTFNFETIKNGLNFTFTTTKGSIDILGEVIGGGKYEDLVKDSELVVLENFSFNCLNIHQLILTKRSAGRPKDLETLAELELILENKNT